MGRGKNKQKQQPQVIHIEELEIENKVDIDYDKLAQAISKAMLMHEQEKEAVQKETKERKKRPNRFRGSIMATANMMAPILIAIFSTLSCIGMWNEYANEAVFELITYIKLTVLFVTIAVISVCCGIESWKDDDENAIMHFNTNVALVALIVALVALVKEVG